MKNIAKILTVAAGLFPFASQVSAQTIDPGEISIYDNDYPVLVNGELPKPQQRIGDVIVSGYNLNDTFNLMTIVCATPSNALTHNAIIRSYFYEGEMKFVAEHGADPLSWSKVPTYLDKPYDYAIAPDGNTFSLNTYEEYRAFITLLEKAEWNLNGYPRERTQDFVSLASLQCGAGY